MDTLYTEDNIETVAEEVLSHLEPSVDRATVVGFEGDLGAGKTTLVQAIAKELGVREAVISPTFVIAKFYSPKNESWDNVVHIDAYRIESVGELVPIGFASILAQPKSLVLIEWPERIKEAIPDDAHIFKLIHLENKRRITKK